MTTNLALQKIFKKRNLTHRWGRKSHKHESSGKNTFHERNRYTNEKEESNMLNLVNQQNPKKNVEKKRTNNIQINQEKHQHNYRNQQMPFNNNPKYKWP
jgi:hypothetical protein